MNNGRDWHCRVYTSHSSSSTQETKNEECRRVNDEWTSYPLILPNSSSIWSQNDEPRYSAKHHLILPSKMTRLHAYLSIHCSIQAPLKNEDETNELIMKGVSLSPIYQVTCWGRDDQTRLLLLSLLYLPKDEWRGAKVLYQLYLN